MAHREKEEFFAIDIDDEGLLVSSPNEVKQFFSATVWDDIVTLLKEHKAFLHSQLRKAETLPKVRGIQFSIDEVDAMLNMKARLLGAIEEQKRVAEQKQEQKDK